MPLIELGLFDIHQIDPLSTATDEEDFVEHLDDLALADEVGLDIAFVAERHYLNTYRCQSSSVWLGAASQRTRAMRLGVLAYTLPITPPVSLAEEIATLDRLTFGRIEIGVGLGHRPEELEANGIDPANRVTIFQERLAILEGLLAGGSVTFESDHTTLREIAIHPRPMQQPHPPIWFAGMDASAAMWAGQHGLNLAIGFAPSDTLFGATASFRHGVGIRRQRGDDDTDMRRGQIALMRQVYIGDTDEQVRDEMIDDLMRLSEIESTATEENRPDRRQRSIEYYERLIAEDIFLAGSAETVARGILDARNKLGSSVFLANVYAAGVDQVRVQRSIRALAGPVRDALDVLTSRILPV